MLGSGSGGGGSAGSDTNGGWGGAGAGAILVIAKQINFSGAMQSVGVNGQDGSSSSGSEPNYGESGGGGSGGAIRLEAESISLSGTVSAINGNGYISGNGGTGRIAFHSLGSLSFGSVSPAPYPQGTATPTPTVTVTPTATPTSTPTPLAGWQDNQYAYQSAQHVHAVTGVQRGAATDTFSYDANGNMTQRVEGGVTWTQTFNAENRLASVSGNGQTWTFTYDGDGNRMKQVNPDGKITLFLGGGSYTIEDAAGSPEVTKYYAVAGQQVALSGPDGLQFLLTDHLGSVDAVLNTGGTLASQQRYLPFGSERTIGNGIGETDFGYTGQRDLAPAGLMDYNARWYSQTVGVFTQPDTVVPNPLVPQEFNRFAYVNNNPINYVDQFGFSRTKSPACDGPRDKGCVRGKGISGDLEDWSNYIGPIPEEIIDQLVAQGADPDILTNVTIHIKQDEEWSQNCTDENYLAVTWSNTIYICQLKPEVFNPNKATPVLLHELIHVMQFNQYPDLTVLEQIKTGIYRTRDDFFEWRNENWPWQPNGPWEWTPYDPYHWSWVEVQARKCEEAYRVDLTIPLDRPPCNLNPFD